MPETLCAKAAPPPLAVLPAFSESTVWAAFGDGWQHIHGNFRELGFSVEWHDFTAKEDLDWAPSFHSGGIEICLNLAGRARVQDGARGLEFSALTAGFYGQSTGKLSAERRGGERHQFITVELSRAFLAQHLSPASPHLHWRLAGFVEGSLDTYLSEPIRLTNEQQQVVKSLRHPPVQEAAQRMWYHAKALEIAALFLYQAPSGEELFCQRQKRHNQDRVQKVIDILKARLSEPLTLEEIGKSVGCSHFHLSRIFSQETGQSIFQCLRRLRLDRAAEMLRERKWTITQIALEVGYSSASHFSTAFHEAFGCCPGLYPLVTDTQKSSREQQAIGA